MRPSKTTAMTTDPDTLKDRILREIRSGEVSMRPRAYFALKIAALVVVALAALGVSIFLFNFIAFSIRINSQDALFLMGPRGWGAFFAFFPWTLLALDALLVLALEWLVRRFSWGYKVPMLYLLAGLAVLTIGTGVLMDRATPLNDRLWHAHRGLPPPFGDLYRSARHHDVDDSLRQFGIPPPPDFDGAPGAQAASASGRAATSAPRLP